MIKLWILDTAKVKKGEITILTMDEYLEIELPDGKVRTYAVGVLKRLGRQIYLGLVGDNSVDTMTTPYPDFEQVAIVALDNDKVYARATAAPYNLYIGKLRNPLDPSTTSELSFAKAGSALPLFNLNIGNSYATFTIARGDNGQGFAVVVRARGEQPSDRLETVLQKHQPFS